LSFKLGLKLDLEFALSFVFARATHSIAWLLLSQRGWMDVLSHAGIVSNG